MNAFGWILVTLLGLATIDPKTDRNASILCLTLLVSILVWGTGNGL